MCIVIFVGFTLLLEFCVRKTAGLVQAHIEGCALAEIQVF